MNTQRHSRTRLEPVRTEPGEAGHWLNSVGPGFSAYARRARAQSGRPAAQKGGADSFGVRVATELEAELDRLPPAGAAASRRVPTLARSGGERRGQLIDARQLFSARAVPSPMAAVDSASVQYEPRAGSRRARATIPIPTQVLLQGQAVALWYHVDTAALAIHLGRTPLGYQGKSLLGVCVGHFRPILLQEEREALLGGRDSIGDDLLTEVTLITLVRSQGTPQLCQVSRLVDASPSGVLRELAHGRPRELAYMRFAQEEHQWDVTALWRTGEDALEISVRDRHWLNLLGLGQVMLRGLASGGALLPLGGSLVSLDTGAPGRLLLGSPQQIQLPARVHLGLLTPDAMARPELVTLLPLLRVHAPTLPTRSPFDLRSTGLPLQ